MKPENTNEKNEIACDVACCADSVFSSDDAGPGCGCAASQEEALEFGKLEAALPESAEDALNGLSVMDSLDLKGGLDTIIENVSGSADGLFKTGLRSAVIILIIAVFCSVVGAIYGENGPNYVILAGILAISAVAVSDVHSFIGLGKTTLDDLNTFSKMLLPTLTAAAAASGAFTSAAAKYAATALFMDLLMTISSTVVMPLIYAYTAASIAGAAIGGEGLQGAASFLKWLTTWILTAMMIAFTAYLTLTGVIAGTTDAAASRSLRRRFPLFCRWWAGLSLMPLTGRRRCRRFTECGRDFWNAGRCGHLSCALYQAWRTLSVL